MCDKLYAAPMLPVVKVSPILLPPSNSLPPSNLTFKRLKVSKRALEHVVGVIKSNFCHSWGFRPYPIAIRVVWR